MVFCLWLPALNVRFVAVHLRGVHQQLVLFLFRTVSVCGHCVVLRLDRDVPSPSIKLGKMPLLKQRVRQSVKGMPLFIWTFFHFMSKISQFLVYRSYERILLITLL